VNGWSNLELKNSELSGNVWGICREKDKERQEGAGSKHQKRADYGRERSLELIKTKRKNRSRKKREGKNNLSDSKEKKKKHKGKKPHKKAFGGERHDANAGNVSPGEGKKKPGKEGEEQRSSRIYQKESLRRGEKE